MQVTIDEDGKTRIKERYVVSAPLAGRLLRIDKDPGDEVVAGETLLATIEPSDPDLLNPRELAEAEARMKAAESALKRSGPLLEQSRAALDFAETELARQNKLRASGAASAEDLDNARLLYRTRSEDFRAATFAEEIARYELEQARAALLRTKPNGDAMAESNTDDKWQFEIRSPISGRVLRVFQESSSIVTPGMSLLEVGDPADLEFEIDVLSNDAVKIDPGDQVIVEHWGGTYPLSGSVRLVEPSAFTKISALGVEEQRVNVIVDLMNRPEERKTLGDGYRIEAKIVVWESNDVLRVPVSSLFREGEEWAVFVVRGDRARRQIVQIGQRNAIEAELLEKHEKNESERLKENDLVIVHPGDTLEDGSAVVPRE